ncbi:MAG: phosphatidylglycerol lysyltransferase domain-containing protein [Schaedlerella sp.]|nr:phosphatidylglycerol lysyltransferase domain-containing protein [Schaedlerella sp.]
MKGIEFKRPELEDQEIMKFYFAKAPGRSCERTFANIYLWSRHYPVTYAIVDDTLVFRSAKDKLAFAYPVGEPEAVKKTLDRMIQYFQETEQEIIFYNITEEQFAQIENWYPGQFQIEYDRDIADYVYEQEKLDTLAGSKLSAKRNHINKFKKLYDNWSYEALTEDNVEECFQMALKWRNDNGCEDHEGKRQEICVTLNSLRLLKELNLTGGILRVDEEIVAFTIGEELCKDTFVVHIEKAMNEYEGAYQMINQQFVRNECADYQYINREEDTGSEGLRKAKLSYKPAFLVEKGYVTLKNNLQ